MAQNAIKTEEEKWEYLDTPEVLDAKVSELAGWVRDSQYMSVFTGAGISTAAGIPDYRSGYGTIMDTGPGKWEKAALLERYKNDHKKAGIELPKAFTMPFNTTIVQARPSLTHMALVKLMNEDILKYIVTQNVDGLHIKSGIDIEKISELHGNGFTEVCVKCNRFHMRDYRTRTAKANNEHKTGALCDTPSCRGALKDTIINFGEALNTEVLQAATV